MFSKAGIEKRASRVGVELVIIAEIAELRYAKTSWLHNIIALICTLYDMQVET